MKFEKKIITRYISANRLIRMQRDFFSLLLVPILSIQVSPTLYNIKKSIDIIKILPFSYEFQTSNRNIYKWVRYGPLLLDPYSIRSKGTIRLTKAFNANYQPLYLAVNCNNNLLNITGDSIQWKGWFSAKEKFEFNIISFLCNPNLRR